MEPLSLPSRHHMLRQQELSKCHSPQARPQMQPNDKNKKRTCQSGKIEGSSKSGEQQKPLGRTEFSGRRWSLVQVCNWCPCCFLQTCQFLLVWFQSILNAWFMRPSSEQLFCHFAEELRVQHRAHWSGELSTFCTREGQRVWVYRKCANFIILLFYRYEPSFNVMKGHKEGEYKRNPWVEEIIQNENVPFSVAISGVKRIPFHGRIAWWVEGGWIHQSAKCDKKMPALWRPDGPV